MKLNKIIKLIEKISPLDYAVEWDNTGVQLRVNDEINKILVCLEITDAVIDEAIKKGAQLIITHHPLIFSPIRSVDNLSLTGRYIEKLVKNNISVYSTHIPFDTVDKGNNRYLAELIGLSDITYIDDEIGVEAYLEQEMLLFNFVTFLKDKMALEGQRLNVVGDYEKAINKIAICTGSGSSLIKKAIEDECDVLITGDLKYHDALLAKEFGFAIIDAGHYGTEKFFAENFAKQLKEVTVEEDIEIIISDIDINPFISL
ncbi:MAG: Nif3-like dinuclear metal center hexameric protein [Eubacteriales bacterium]|nr:Nif3-like dinuclear metal center hexameric protein [Eubacteriales bacterium]MDY3333075.1 Nif3-like dinuclear metal center hexameric protein [Gallibacter sp.]